MYVLLLSSVLRLPILLQVVLLKELVEFDLETGCLYIDFSAVFENYNSLILLVPFPDSLYCVCRSGACECYATLLMLAFVAHLAEAHRI